MKLSESKQRKLHTINKMLKEEHAFDVKLDPSLSVKTLKNIKRDVLKEQKEISYSKAPQDNPHYSQCLLVLEAVDLLLNEKDTSIDFSAYNRSSSTFQKIDELEGLLESVKAKNPAKAKVLEKKINGLKERMYTESKENEIRMMLKEDAQEAEVIMAGRNMFDTVQSFQTKIGELMNKNLDPFIERVRSVYGSKTADKVYTMMNDSLDGLLQDSRKTKEVFYNAVGVLTGEYNDEDEDMSVDDADLESLDTDDAEDLDTDLEGSDEGLDDEDMDLDLDSLDDSEETFTRKED